MEADYEKLGVFYLGKQYDLQAGKATSDLLLYDSKDLTTHALCVGMTGSGKTGLCLALLEEAAIDGIPAICIDPKGDLGNLLLTFPQLKPGDFKPYIDPADATRRGQTLDECAADTAARWKAGLAEWDQKPERIARLRDAADVAIYTPGSQAGLPLTVLRSFDAPPQAVRDNAEALRDRVAGAAAALLALLGIDADPLQSREHILLANLFDRAWREGQNLDLGGLIRLIQNPPFDKVGFLDLESFFPAKERFALAMRLNNLLASPGFAGWLTGEPLDIPSLLHTPEGKPRLSILSIAHLNDSERMFFVTVLLGEVLSWMRTQSGSSSLRAILYMDEVFGFFPPVANPPSKAPMLTLLKQARAFGLGIALATQNPVDLDYKGLANCGTWLLGRLQTERDKARVLDGLEGASTAAGKAFDREKMASVLSGLKSRVFLMNNVHDDAPCVFQSRWALSYLRGPLSREQIQQLMQERKDAPPAAGAAPAKAIDHAAQAADARPVLPPGIVEQFVAVRGPASKRPSKLVYRPTLVAQVRVHYTQTKSKVDWWDDYYLSADIGEALSDNVWNEAERLEDGAPDVETQPEDGAAFASLPAELTRPKTYDKLTAALKDHLYRTATLELYSCPKLGAAAKPGESEGEFRVRLAQSAREERDLQVEKLRAKYTPKLAALAEQARRAQQRVEKESAEANQSMVSAAITAGGSLLGAMFGRKMMSAANASRAGSAARAASRVAKQRQDVGQAQETVMAIQERHDAMEAEFNEEVESVRSSFDAHNLVLEMAEIRPKKTDVSVQQVTLTWVT